MINSCLKGQKLFQNSELLIREEIMPIENKKEDFCYPNHETVWSFDLEYATII